MRRQPRRFRKAMTSLHVFGVGELVKSARETLELTLMAQAGQISRRDPCGAKVSRPRDAALARNRQRPLAKCRDSVHIWSMIQNVGICQ